MSPKTESRTRTAIRLASLAATAWFVADGVTALTGAALLPLEPAPPAPSARGAGPTPPATAGPAPADPDPILARNVFDHVLGDPRAQAVEDVPDADAAEAVPEDPDEMPACEGSLRLAGTLVRPDQPSMSVATITTASGTAKLYRPRPGEDDVDGRTLVAVRRLEVWLRPEDGPICRLALFGAGAPPTRARTARPVADEDAPRLSRGRAAGLSEDLEKALDEGITELGGGRYRLDRSLVERLMTRELGVLRRARIVPNREGGRVVGMRLSRLRREGVFSRLGLENGDTIRSINGFEMTSPDSALQALARLREADRLTVQVLRKGQPTSLDFEIQ